YQLVKISAPQSKRRPTGAHQNHHVEALADAHRHAGTGKQVSTFEPVQLILEDMSKVPKRPNILLIQPGHFVMHVSFLALPFTNPRFSASAYNPCKCIGSTIESGACSVRKITTRQHCVPGQSPQSRLS